MAKFTCSLCERNVELTKHVVKVVDGKVVCPDATCCEEYMKPVRENAGFGSALSRPGGTVRGKNDGLRTN